MTRRELLGPVTVGRERLEFLSESADVRPEMLTSLRALLPAWSKAGKHTGAEADLLQPWMRRFNLDAQWMWRALRSTLSYWTVVPPREPLAWPPSVKNVAYRMPVPEPPSFALPQWEPDVETSARYVARVSSMAKRAAGEYVRLSEEQIVQSKDWRLEKQRRRPGPKRRPQPLRWLALYQVGRRSFQQIATTHGVHASSVYSAVTGSARRIDIKLRKS